MKKSRYTDRQIIALGKQAQAGTPVPELCREHGMSSATLYKWRAKYGGMDASMSETCYRYQSRLTSWWNLRVSTILGRWTLCTTSAQTAGASELSI